MQQLSSSFNFEASPERLLGRESVVSQTHSQTQSMDTGATYEATSARLTKGVSATSAATSSSGNAAVNGSGAGRNTTGDLWTGSTEATASNTNTHAHQQKLEGYSQRQAIDDTAVLQALQTLRSQLAGEVYAQNKIDALGATLQQQEQLQIQLQNKKQLCV